MAQKEYHYIFNKWRDFDFMTTCLAISGLLLSIINYEYVILSSPVIDKDKNPDPKLLERNTNSITVTLRLIVTITTLLSSFCLYKRHLFQMYWSNKYITSTEKNPNHITFMYDDIINLEKNEFTQRKSVITKHYIFE